MPRAVQSVGTAVLVALAVLASAPSWAQQKPGSGANPQSAAPQSGCTPQKVNMCRQSATAICGTDAACASKTTNDCLENCGRP
jgi:hypothetical protein